MRRKNTQKNTKAQNTQNRMQNIQNKKTNVNQIIKKQNIYLKHNKEQKA